MSRSTSFFARVIIGPPPILKECLASTISHPISRFARNRSWTITAKTSFTPMKNRTLTSFVLVSLFWTVFSVRAARMKKLPKQGNSPPPKNLIPPDTPESGSRQPASRHRCSQPARWQPLRASLGDEAGSVEVKNTAYDSEGTVIASIKGKAILVEGEPKGRFKVGFGPHPQASPTTAFSRSTPIIALLSWGHQTANRFGSSPARFR